MFLFTTQIILSARLEPREPGFRIHYRKAEALALFPAECPVCETMADFYLNFSPQSPQHSLAAMISSEDVETIPWIKL